MWAMLLRSEKRVAVFSSLIPALFGLVWISAGERYALVELGTIPGCLESRPTAINNRGQVVGWSETAEGFSRAFLWANGAMTDLKDPDGSQSIACGINNVGTIVGVAM